MSSEEKEVYVGDGVYASFEKGMIKLRTQRSNGEHYIYLEPEVYMALAEFANSIWGGHPK